MRKDILKPWLITTVLICALACCVGLEYPVGIAGWLVAAVMAVKLPLSVSRESLRLKSIASEAYKLSAIALPACFTAAVGAEVGQWMTVVFAFSAFIPLLYIFLSISLVRISAAVKHTSRRLVLMTIGYFALLFVPSLAAASSYNCTFHSYFCYELDQFLAGIELGYYVLPITLALVVTFVIAPMLSKHGQWESMGWIAAIYGVFIALWLFFPRIPMENTDGRNPYVFRLLCGRQDFAETAEIWLVFTAFAVLLGWLSSFSCTVFRKLRQHQNA
ncbi:MAG: hypothetical protein E7559_07525 [Ruminococcaceae bacterium]|nr:hypothetical protein [Oscillospiraceae bacterium]